MPNFVEKIQKIDARWEEPRKQWDKMTWEERHDAGPRYMQEIKEPWKELLEEIVQNGGEPPEKYQFIIRFPPSSMEPRLYVYDAESRYPDVISCLNGGNGKEEKELIIKIAAALNHIEADVSFHDNTRDDEEAYRAIGPWINLFRIEKRELWHPSQDESQKILAAVGLEATLEATGDSLARQVMEIAKEGDKIPVPLRHLQSFMRDYDKNIDSKLRDAYLGGLEIPENPTREDLQNFRDRCTSCPGPVFYGYSGEKESPLSDETISRILSMQADLGGVDIKIDRDPDLKKFLSRLLPESSREAFETRFDQTHEEIVNEVHAQEGYFYEFEIRENPSLADLADLAKRCAEECERIGKNDWEHDYWHWENDPDWDKYAHIMGWGDLKPVLNKETVKRVLSVEPSPGDVKTLAKQDVNIRDYIRHLLPKAARAEFNARYDKAEQQLFSQHKEEIAALAKDVNWDLLKQVYAAQMQIDYDDYTAFPEYEDRVYSNRVYPQVLERVKASYIAEQKAENNNQSQTRSVTRRDEHEPKGMPWQLFTSVKDLLFGQDPAITAGAAAIKDLEINEHPTLKDILELATAYSETIASIPESKRQELSDRGKLFLSRETIDRILSIEPSQDDLKPFLNETRNVKTLIAEMLPKVNREDFKHRYEQAVQTLCTGDNHYKVAMLYDRMDWTHISRMKEACQEINGPESGKDKDWYIYSNRMERLKTALKEQRAFDKQKSEQERKSQSMEPVRKGQQPVQQARAEDRSTRQTERNNGRVANHTWVSSGPALSTIKEFERYVDRCDLGGVRTGSGSSWIMRDDPLKVCESVRTNTAPPMQREQEALVR